jgi:hypothetical protein
MLVRQAKIRLCGRWRYGSRTARRVPIGSTTTIVRRVEREAVEFRLAQSGVYEVMNMAEP